MTNLSVTNAEFGGEDRETAALGVNQDDDQWAKYAFKVATGAGKTKIMSLAVVRMCSFAPVFTSLLGPMDGLARGMILRELKKGYFSFQEAGLIG